MYSFYRDVIQRAVFNVPEEMRKFIDPRSHSVRAAARLCMLWLTALFGAAVVGTGAPNQTAGSNEHDLRAEAEP